MMASPHTVNWQKIVILSKIIHVLITILRSGRPPSPKLKGNFNTGAISPSEHPFQNTTGKYL
jgi:hypothetical protein